MPEQDGPKIKRGDDLTLLKKARKFNHVTHIKTILGRRGRVDLE